VSRRPRRVVVLGASGYIGSAVAASLAREPNVTALGYSSATLDLSSPHAVEGLEAVVGPDTTVLLVSALTPDRGQTIATFMTNLQMVANVARCLETHVVSRCVYISSDAVYGFDVNPVTEATPVAPAGSYALAKYAGERLLESVGAARGFPVASLRVTGVYGPGDPHSAYGPNAFARSIAGDHTVRLFGQGEEERDHIYIDDVARLVTALTLSEETGVFNVATGESRTFREIVETLRGLVPYEIGVTSVPRKGPITHRRFDTTRLRRTVPDLGLTPFKEGAKATLRAFGALSHA
jgi:UDP-glucose 4-epimerase